jgi:hypothetical protein
LQHPLRADFFAAWELHYFGAQIAGALDGRTHVRHELLPAFGGEDGWDDVVADWAKRRADHAVEARMFCDPLAQVHTIVRHLVGIVHALGDVFVQLLLGA